MLNRRDLLTALGAMPMAAPLAARTRAPARLALCDISVRKALATDYAGTLKKVAAIGYTHFSFRLERWLPTEAPDPPPRDKARMTADAGLQLGVVRFLDAPNLDRYIDETNAAGAKILALTTGDIFMERTGAAPLTIAQVDDFAQRLDGWGARARAAGVTLAYHNHAADGTRIGGIRPFDRILELTDPHNVAVELDFAWAFAAGFDLLATVRRLGPRLVSMHWKDFDGRPNAEWSKPQPVEIGAGVIGLSSLLPKIAAVTSALPGVEIENSSDELASARRGYGFCANALRHR